MDAARARLERQARRARSAGQAPGEEQQTPAAAVLALQGSAGNAAVARLLEDEQGAGIGAGEAAAAPASVAELESGARSAIAGDVETVVQLLARPSMDEAGQEAIAAVIRRWRGADSMGGSSTPHLDELLRLLKERPLHRRSVRSMEAATAETAYDALWLVLEEEALGEFASAAAQSGEGSTGPLGEARAAFWAGLPRGRAMGLYAAFEAVAPGADRHEDDAVERLSRALAGIEADPEWMRMVEAGGENRGGAIFGSEYAQAERLLLRTEASRVGHAGARYLWRMVESSEEEMPWLSDPVEASEAAREVRLAGREIARRMDFQHRITRLSGPGIQRDPRVLAEIVRLTGWITRLAARGHGTDDSSSRDALRRLAREVARELELAGTRVQPGTYERELVAALERPDRDLPERQEEVAGVLLDLVGAGAEQLVESGHPGGGASADEPSPTPPNAE